LAAVVTGVQLGDRDACRVLRQRTQLITLQSHQRTHHDRHAAQRQPGELVDRRLACPGGKNGERVLPLEHCPDGLGLARPQHVETEPIASAAISEELTMRTSCPTPRLSPYCERVAAACDTSTLRPRIASKILALVRIPKARSSRRLQP